MRVAVVVPVLNRAHRVRPLMASVEAATDEYRLLFVANEGDAEEIAELQAAGADHIVVDASRISWACKINDGFRATTEEWVLTAADDLHFHPGWFDRALLWAAENTGVIGTNDICNPLVMTGKHSTHSLFRRSYVEQFGTIDQPGIVMHEGYRHDYVDNEAVTTAMVRGVYVHAFDAIVEHLHPLSGKAADDQTYKTGRKFSAQGRALFQKRKALWADENLVRMAMVPTPERAVVVTASYGNYDPHLHVPAPQDMPVEFVCFTDNPDLEVPEPWKVILEEPRWPDNPRLSAKVPKMCPDVGCDDVVWIDASHEITAPSFVREALAARRDGIAAFAHPRRNDPFQEIAALLGAENQNGLYFHRPLQEQADAYAAEGHPRGQGLFACGTLAWDLRDERARELGREWLEETAKWSHQDQPEFPVVARRLGVNPGTFPIAQLDPKYSRGKPWLGNRWFRIHPHVIKSKPVAVSVLIPFTSTDPLRLANYEHVRGWYEAKGYEVVTGSCEGEWSKGAALADAFRSASHDVLVIADADCLLDDTSLDKAVQAVASGAPWVVPMRKVWRLGKASASRVLHGQRPRPQGQQIGPVIGGGIVVCSREAWEKTGGIDPRFLLWGAEDLAFGLALTTLCGPPVMGKGQLFHLWHVPEQRGEKRPMGHENSLLHSRYRDASGDVEAMEALVAETRVLA